MKKFFIIICVFFSCLYIPSTAFAYLDPGTGNALVYVFLSLVGAVLYFIKGVFYRVINKKQASNVGNTIDASFGFDAIVIFNEGKAYWNVFKPVVEKLIEKKQKFTYYTMDLKDPCLLIDNDYMDNCYIGNGNIAFSKIGNLNANIVLSTTPNIGTKGYPIPRSKSIKKLIHIFHAFTDFSFYHCGSLDNYDAVLLMGEFEKPIIRKIESSRNLPEKELYPAGLPYMDELVKKNKTVLSKKGYKNTKDITLLLAPSWGDKGFLSYYGTQFIEDLAGKEFNIIIRPHPQSLKSEKRLLDSIITRLKDHKNITWDFNPDGSKSFQSADILISDTSGVRFDFAIVYQKPFITIPLVISEEALADYEISVLGFSWTEKELQKIGYGYTLKENEIEHLDKIIMNVLQQKSNEAIIDFRKKNIYNLGHSGEVIADYLIDANNRIQNDVKRDTD